MIMNLPAEKRHLAFKALPYELFNKGGKMHGYAVSSGEACLLSDEHCTVLSHIPSSFILLEDIHQHTVSALDGSELLDILKDLSDTGFIKKFDKHTRPISSINIFPPTATLIAPIVTVEKDAGTTCRAEVTVCSRNSSASKWEEKRLITC